MRSCTSSLRIHRINRRVAHRTKKRNGASLIPLAAYMTIIGLTANSTVRTTVTHRAHPRSRLIPRT